MRTNSALWSRRKVSVLSVFAAVLLVVGIGCNEEPPASDGDEGDVGGDVSGDVVDGGPLPDGSTMDVPDTSEDGITDDGGMADSGLDAGGTDADACMPTNGGTETCDGLDNDCDGTVDEDVEPGDCDNQDGVCAGSTTTACMNGEYQACGASEFGSDYIASDDESWACDGLDNDCDTTTDEACCGAAGNDPEPTPVQVGSLMTPNADRHYDGLTLPAATQPAASGAPADAELVAAWISGPREVRVQHLAADGSALGTSKTITISQASGADTRELTGVAITTTSRGYDVIYHTATVAGGVIPGPGGGFDSSALRAQGLNGDLSDDGSEVTLVDGGTTSAPAVGFARLHAAEQNDRVLVAGTAYNDPSDITSADVQAYSYNINNRQSQFSGISMPGPVDAQTSSSSGRPADLAARPQVATSSAGGFGIAWATSFDGGDASLNAVRTDGSGGVTGSANTTFTTNNNQTSRLGLAWTSADELFVLHDNGSDLMSVTLNVDTGSASGLTTVLADSRAPHFVARDTDGDDFADEATATWLTESAANPSNLEVTAGAFEFGSPSSTISDDRIRVPSQGVGAPVPSAIANGLGVLWPLQPAGQPQVEYAPASQSGVGICQP